DNGTRLEARHDAITWTNIHSPVCDSSISGIVFYRRLWAGPPDTSGEGTRPIRRDNRWSADRGNDGWPLRSAVNRFRSERRFYVNPGTWKAHHQGRREGFPRNLTAN